MIASLTLPGARATDSLPRNVLSYEDVQTSNRPVDRECVPFLFTCQSPSGNIVLPDYGQARTWLERAGRRGDARAAMLLGHMYRLGLAVPADAKEAYAWSEVAAVEGSPFAPRERDQSFNALSVADRQVAVARAHEILDGIKHEIAVASVPH